MADANKDVIVQSKPTLQSKQVWLGVIVAVASAIVLACDTLLGQNWVKDYPTVISILGMASGITSVVLRMITTGPVNFAVPAASRQNTAHVPMPGVVDMRPPQDTVAGIKES